MNTAETVNAQTATMSMAERLNAMKAAAAAKYGANTASVSEVSEVQKVRDINRKVLASLTIAACVARVVSAENKPENVDIDKTAQKLLTTAKRVLTGIAKTAIETAEAGNVPETSELESFTVNHPSVTLEFVTIAVPEKYKGVLMAIDFNSISDEAKLKLAAIGITSDFPFGTLTSVTLDKSVNVIFVKVGGFDLSIGTVRLSQKYVLPVENTADEVYNDVEAVECYTAKIAELTSQMKAPAMKFSPKSFDYVAKKLAENLESEAVKNAHTAVFGSDFDAANIKAVIAFVAHFATVEDTKAE